MNSPDKAQEIIIIKRGGEGEEGHHGGAWKIAFADFMTAMMALFLVLWLINAANEETKKAVASYFNPVKLVDRNRSVKGLHDAEGIQEMEVEVTNDKYPEKKEPVTDPGDQQSRTDTQFFADPFAALDEIATPKAPGELSHLEEEGGRNGNDAINDAAGGEAFMDPFSPNFWNEEVRPSNNNRQLAGRSETEGRNKVTDAEEIMASVQERAAGKMEAGEMAAGEQAGGEAGIAAGEKKAGTGDVATAGAPPAPMETAAIGENIQDVAEQSGETVLPEAIEQEVAAYREKAAAEAKKTAFVKAAAEDLRSRIAEKLDEAFADGSGLAGELSVTASGDEVLISLTDAFDISMYEIGSAVPSRDLVIALEKIGGVLAEQPGGVRIHGHTDARPFKSKDYDNWRLSAARAQSAYYMLLRGGLDETRVHEISGFADRQLLDPENPLSHKNRRIEVLVEVPSA